MSVTLKISIPDDAFSAIRKNPSEFAQEMRLAAAVKWYEMGSISQEKAAEIAGVSRMEFIHCLERYSVSPFQYTPDEVMDELKR